MQPTERERWIYFPQIFAAITLAISSFLPFYTTAMDEVRYAEALTLFFWPIPVIILLYVVPNRWLKAILCVLSGMGGVISLVLITFLATFKSHPLMGFEIARLSLIVLMGSWLIVFIIALTSRPAPKAN